MKQKREKVRFKDYMDSDDVGGKKGDHRNPKERAKDQHRERAREKRQPLDF